MVFLFVVTEYTPTMYSKQDLLSCFARPIAILQSLGIGQLHWAPPLGWQEEAYWEGLAKLRAAGRIREVGLSNYGPKGVARAHRFLANLETPLASNQVDASLCYVCTSLY